jgi:hypothetical protein
LADGECTDPSDLSALAEIVHNKTGSQIDLVNRLPKDKLRNAMPNLGTTIAAALLREGAVSAVLSLNFDLSVQRALAELGETNHVAVIRGPEDHGDIANVNFIYLHRSVEADPEDWVLRSQDLEVSWKNGWEEMMAARVMAAAAAVFAGLGSRAAVLVETTEKIRSASGGNARAFQVDPSAYGESDFAEALQITEEDYVQCGWSEFMVALSARLVLVHLDQLEQSCQQIIEREGWDDSAPKNLRERLSGLGIVDLGRLRARWLMSKAPYAPGLDPEGTRAAFMADLLLGIGLIEKGTDGTAVFNPDGIVDFIDQAEELVGSLAIASGRGEMRWGALEAELHQQRSREGVAARKPRCALVSNVLGSHSEEVAPPEDVSGEDPSAESIVGTGGPLRVVSVDQLRGEPGLAEELIA